MLVHSFISPGRTALLALLLAAAAPARAQDYFSEVDVAVGYGPARITWPSLQKFFDSYHQANRADVVSAATIPYGRVQSLAVNYLSVGGLRYERLMASTETRLNPGLTRHFELRQQLAMVTVEPAWRGRHLFIGPTFGLGAGEVRVGTYMSETDGTVSWGRARRLNGNYTATVITGVGGLRLGYQWQYVQLGLRAEWVSSGGTNVSLSDNLPGDITNEIPTDYADFLANPPVGVGARVYDSVTPDLTSYRVCLSLGLRLNPAPPKERK